MNETELYIKNAESEYNTTLKVIKAYPEDKLDFKPHEISRSAKELLWLFATEANVLLRALDEGFQVGNKPPAVPDTKEEIIDGYKKNYTRLFEKVKSMSEDDLNKTVKFPSGPGQMGDFRRIDMAWMMLKDMIHHRGQLSVYLRTAGGKVPSIYGPSYDEPWR